MPDVPSDYLLRLRPVRSLRDPERTLRAMVKGMLRKWGFWCRDFREWPHDARTPWAGKGVPDGPP